VSAAPPLLLNTPLIEVWPAWAVRAKASEHARAVASAHWVLRRKADGRLLATVGPQGLRPLGVVLAREEGLEDALDAICPANARGTPKALQLTTDAVDAANAALGLRPDYAEQTGLPLQPEPTLLHYAGRDRYSRPLWLSAPAARGWRAMRVAAAHEGVALQAISGYRSHAYQQGIVLRKLARGQTLAEVLRVNAAPGFSEHHGGMAIDIGTVGEPPAEESFEATPAFAWLQQRAGNFGFQLSYPRGNPHGISYEPWHWCWRPATG